MLFLRVLREIYNLSRLRAYLNPTPKALLVNSLSTIERESSFLPSPRERYPE
jgi:hypothetical protein